MAATPFVSAPFSGMADDPAATSAGGRRRHRRTALAFLALLVVACLVLLLLGRRPGHSPFTTHGSPIAGRKETAKPSRQKPPWAGGLFTNTCPKSIAASCVAGQKMYLGVCVGKHRGVARTPTRQDVQRLDRAGRKIEKEIREGKRPNLPKLPTEITGHMLPNGRFVGTCEYGDENPAVLARKSGNY